MKKLLTILLLLFIALPLFAQDDEVAFPILYVKKLIGADGSYVVVDSIRVGSILLADKDLAPFGEYKVILDSTLLEFLMPLLNVMQTNVGIHLYNSGEAISVLPRYSPPIIWRSNYWNSGLSTSDSCYWALYAAGGQDHPGFYLANKKGTGDWHVTASFYAYDITDEVGLYVADSVWCYGFRSEDLTVLKDSVYIRTKNYGDPDYKSIYINDAPLHNLRKIFATDATWTFYPDKVGWGYCVFNVGGSLGYANFVFLDDGSVTLISNVSCSTTQDGIDTFNIYDGGEAIVFQNKTGVSINVVITIFYGAP